MRTRMAGASALASVLLLVGCGHQHSSATPPGAATGKSAWREVINDWLDSGIDHPHSCAAVREAVAHLPMSSPAHSTAHRDLGVYERKVC